MENDNKMIKKVFEFKATKEENGVYTAVITTSNIDRENEVLLANGMDPTEFEKSGTIFYNHDYDLPIAKNLSITKGRGRWTSKFKMAERPEDFEGQFFPDYIKTLIDQKIIKGVSVGFQPLEGRRPTKKDIKDYGEDIRRVITRWKLMEFSIAPLQSNTEAVITSVKSAVNDKTITKEIAENIIPDLYKEEIVEEVEEKEIEHIVIELSPQKKDIKEEVKKHVEIELARRKGQLYI